MKQNINMPHFAFFVKFQIVALAKTTLYFAWHFNICIIPHMSPNPESGACFLWLILSHLFVRLSHLPRNIPGPPMATNLYAVKCTATDTHGCPCSGASHCCHEWRESGEKQLLMDLYYIPHTKDKAARDYPTQTNLVGAKKVRRVPDDGVGDVAYTTRYSS